MQDVVLPRQHLTALLREPGVHLLDHRLAFVALPHLGTEDPAVHPVAHIGPDAVVVVLGHVGVVQCELVADEGHAGDLLPGVEHELLQLAAVLLEARTALHIQLSVLHGVVGHVAPLGEEDVVVHLRGQVAELPLAVAELPALGGAVDHQLGVLPIAHQPPPPVQRGGTGLTLVAHVQIAHQRMRVVARVQEGLVEGGVGDDLLHEGVHVEPGGLGGDHDLVQGHVLEQGVRLGGECMWKCENEEDVEMVEPAQQGTQDPAILLLQDRTWHFISTFPHPSISTFP